MSVSLRLRNVNLFVFNVSYYKYIYTVMMGLTPHNFCKFVGNACALQRLHRFRLHFSFVQNMHEKVIDYLDT